MTKKTKTLYFQNEGPMLQYNYKNTAFIISDLNPECNTHWNISRWELFKLGWRMVWTSLS